MKRIIIIPMLLCLTACQTAKPIFTTLTGGYGGDVSLTDKSKYYNIFDGEILKSSLGQSNLKKKERKQKGLERIVETVDLQRCLKMTMRISSTSSTSHISTIPCTVSSGVDELMICFEKMEYSDKMMYRRQLVDNTIRKSDANCEVRQDNVGVILTSGNITGDFLTTLANSVGAIASDSITSRVASGVAGAGNSIWGKTKSEFLAGSNYEKVKNTIKEARNASRKDIDEKAKFKGGKSYNEWPLSAVIRDLDVYDRTCDMFK